MLFKKSSNTFAFPILRADTKSQFMNLGNVKMIRNAIRYVQKNYINPPCIINAVRHFCLTVSFKKPLIKKSCEFSQL